MKSIAVPKFSERYQAQADAERQYVFGIRRPYGDAGERPAENAAGGGPYTADKSIEAAFRLVRTQNRSDKSSSDPGC